MPQNYRQVLALGTSLNLLSVLGGLSAAWIVATALSYAMAWAVAPFSGALVYLALESARDRFRGAPPAEKWRPPSAGDLVVDWLPEDAQLAGGRRAQGRLRPPTPLTSRSCTAEPVTATQPHAGRRAGGAGGADQLVRLQRHVHVQRAQRRPLQDHQDPQHGEPGRADGDGEILQRARDPAGASWRRAEVRSESRGCLLCLVRSS